jgi:hypothetical protein
MCLLGCAAAGLVVVSTRGVYEQLAQHLHELQQEEAQDMMQQVRVLFQHICFICLGAGHLLEVGVRRVLPMSTASGSRQLGMPEWVVLRPVGFCFPNQPKFAAAGAAPARAAAGGGAGHDAAGEVRTHLLYCLGAGHFLETGVLHTGLVRQHLGVGVKELWPLLFRFPNQQKLQMAEHLHEEAQYMMQQVWVQPICCECLGAGHLMEMGMWRAAP